MQPHVSHTAWLSVKRYSCRSPIYIKKELSRTVVRELLPRATAHGHQTFPDYGRHTRSRSKGGDVREEAPAEECTAKTLQTNVRHLGFTEKIYGFPRTLLCCQYKRRTPTVVRELLPRTSTKRAQTFPAVLRCTSHQYKVVDVQKKLLSRSVWRKPRMNRPSAILDLRKTYRTH